MKAGRDTGEREIVWAIYEQLGSFCVESGLKYRNYSHPHCSPVSLQTLVPKDDSEKRRLALLEDKCYEATCVLELLASIDEWS